MQLFIGVASELIAYQPPYRSVITNLLGTVIVTSDLKGANELARLLQYRYRIVTLEGDVVNPGGSMTGGAVKQAKTSLLGRQRELEAWTEKLADMERKTSALEKYIQSLKKVKSAGWKKKASELRTIIENIRANERAQKKKRLPN
ncbi:hypothetical protein GCM10020331_047650 [Ectobacillus funiculus]